MSWPRPRQGVGGGREAPGSRRRRRRGGKCSRGPSTVQLLLPRVQALLSAGMFAQRSVRGECVAARNECSAGQPVPAACGGGGVVKTRGMPLGRSLETSSE